MFPEIIHPEPSMAPHKLSYCCSFKATRQQKKELRKLLIPPTRPERVGARKKVAWRLIKKWFNRYEKKHLIGGTVRAVSRDGQSALCARITGVRLLKGGGHRKSLEFNTKPVEQ